MTTIQEDVVAAIAAVDAKIEDVVVVLDTHTTALAEVRAALDAAIAAQNFTAVVAAKDALVAHTASLAAAADRMRAGDPTPAAQSVVTEPGA